MTIYMPPSERDIRMSDAFDVLLSASAAPGARHPLGDLGLLSLAQCLLDSEATFYADDEQTDAALDLTGARRRALGEAQYVFTSLASPADVARAREAAIGTALYPDTAATIFAPATFGFGTTLQLSGPGIAGDIRLELAGVHLSFWSARKMAAQYPLGWDLFLVSEREVASLPRSTAIEVL